MLILDGVTRSYGTHRVLDDVGFAIGPGRMTRFVGGNGARRATAMRTVLGVWRSSPPGSSGSCCPR